MATRCPELESETESQNDSDTSSEPQPSTEKKTSAIYRVLSSIPMRILSALQKKEQQKNTTGGTKKVKKNSLTNDLSFFFFNLTHILEISRFEVLISRFSGLFFKTSRFACDGGWKVCNNILLLSLI